VPTSSGPPIGSTPASRTSPRRGPSPSTWPAKPATARPRMPSRRTAERLHQGVHGREDQAGRADHHHLRRNLGDPRVDHRARPVAGPPQIARPALPRLGGPVDAHHAAHPACGADAAAFGLRALAALLERSRLDRLTRSQHLLFRLGELVAHAETAAVFAERVVSSPTRATAIPAPTLEVMSRVFAREALHKVVFDGLRWATGAGQTDPDLGRSLALSGPSRPRRACWSTWTSRAEAHGGLSSLGHWTEAKSSRRRFVRIRTCRSVPCSGQGAGYPSPSARRCVPPSGCAR